MTDWGSLLDGMTEVIRDTFAEAAPIAYVRFDDGLTYEVRGIFDFAREDEEAGGSVPGNLLIPVLEVRDGDLPFEPMPEDTVTVAGKGQFRVIATAPSSAGMTKLRLRKKK